MANGFYTAALEGFLAGNIDYDANAIKVTLVDAADYTRNLSTHDFYDDVTAGGRVATSSNFASKTTTGGTADAADITFSSVTGDVSEELIIWVDTGVESTSRLICNFDTVTGLPVTPNGGNINVTWNASGIFRLGS